MTPSLNWRCIWYISHPEFMYSSHTVRTLNVLICLDKHPVFTANINIHWMDLYQNQLLHLNKVCPLVVKSSLLFLLHRKGYFNNGWSLYTTFEGFYATMALKVPQILFILVIFWIVFFLHCTCSTWVGMAKCWSMGASGGGHVPLTPVEVGVTVSKCTSSPPTDLLIV